jgi:hypothetical protein
MDIKLFERLLAARFARTKTTGTVGAVVQTLAKPASLSTFLERTLNTEEERDLYGGTFEAWPGNVHELLDDQSDDLRRGLVVFSWDGWGPVSSAAGFETTDIGGSSYVLFWDEIEGHRVLAAVTPTGDVNGIRSVVHATIAGHTYLHSVPHDVFNDAPSVIDRPFLEGAFTALLDNTCGWGELADEHFARIVEPNHLQRCMDMFTGLRRLDNDEGWAEWIEAIDDNDGSDLSHEARRKLLREYLDKGYEVRQTTRRE